jgi:hypothetical protein
MGSVTGNFMSWFSDIFLPDSAQTSSEQQANIDRLNQEYADRVNRRQEQGDLPSGYNHQGPVVLESQDAAALAGFEEGAAEGFQNVLTAPGKVVGFAGDSASTLLGGILKNIPWWVWAGLAAYLFISLGGLAIVRRRVSKL